VICGHPAQLRATGPEVSGAIRDLVPSSRIWWDLGDSGAETTAEAILLSWVQTAVVAAAAGIERLVLDPGMRFSLPDRFSPVPTPQAAKLVSNLSVRASRALREMVVQGDCPPHHRWATQLLVALRAALEGSGVLLGLSMVCQPLRVPASPFFDMPWKALLTGLGPGGLALPRLYWSSSHNALDTQAQSRARSVVDASQAAFADLVSAGHCPSDLEIGAYLELHRACSVADLLSVSMSRRTTVYWAIPDWLDEPARPALVADAALARSGMSLVEYQRNARSHGRYFGSPTGVLDDATISALTHD